MAIKIKFEKAKAERLIECLNNGKPIEGIRNVDDALALAGACFFLAMSQGSELQQEGESDEDSEPSDEDVFLAELHAAIEYYGQATMLVAAGEYDKSFEPRHQAMVMIEDGEKTVVPVEGVREE